jgi:hypothetical protein
MYMIDIWTQPLLHKQLTITGEQDLHELARNHYKEVKAQLGKMKPKHTFTEISDRTGNYIGESIVHMKDGFIHKPTNRTIYNFHTMYEARLESYRTLKILKDASHVIGFDDIDHLIHAEDEEASNK